MANLPLADFWTALAQEWREDGGWRIPWHFGDWQREYQAAIHGAAVLDLSHRTTLVLTGRDHAAFLHNFCTNDILGTPIGRGCEAFLTTAHAKILAWFHAFREADAIYVDADPGRGPIIVQHLTRYQISEDVAFQDWSGQVAFLHVTGPSAAEVLKKRWHFQAWPGEELSHVLTDLDGQAIRLRRVSRLGQLGWDLLTDIATGRKLVQDLVSGSVQPLGHQAAEVLRVEAGRPVFDRDINETNLPQEVGRDEQAISFSKGCYLGQETVARIRAYGHVNRKLCGLRLPTGEVLPPGTRLVPASTTAGQSGEIGAVTSCVYSPRCGCAIALAWLRRGWWQPGTTVVAEAANGPISATVVSLPFIPATAPAPTSS